jgi:hypothetical protein
VAVWVMLLTHWVAVDGVGVPLQAPAAVDVAVVFSQPEVQRAGEGRDERDVGERPAYEVAAAVRGPVDQVVEAGHDEHGFRLPSTMAQRSGNCQARRLVECRANWWRGLTHGNSCEG